MLAPPAAIDHYHRVHFHGVSAEDIAAIVARQAQPKAGCKPAGGPRATTDREHAAHSGVGRMLPAPRSRHDLAVCVAGPTNTFLNRPATAGALPLRR